MESKQMNRREVLLKRLREVQAQISMEEIKMMQLSRQLSNTMDAIE